MAETDFKYDVFISYSHKDEKWADKVLRQRLDDAGLKVCIDYRDFEAGKMALFNMQDAAKQSKHIVLVLTRNWLNSEWSLFEALMGGTIDPAGLQKKLIPLLCEDGIQQDINDFIAMRTWVDFTRKDREEIAWKQLSDAIGKPATFDIRPATEKWFFGHRYGDIENFTGRTAELKMLDEWLNNDKDNLLVLRALGGFGKSILTWQWFNNNVDKTKWQTAVWWSFYEKESGFESFLAETLKHLGVEVKDSTRQQVNDLLEAMRGANILIVLDGFERLLRQYGRMDAALQSDDENADIDPSQRDCSSPLAETFLRGLSGSNMRSKVLMTTRLCPRALESADGKLLKGCREEPLAAFSPDDAVTYFHNEGIKATRAEIIEVCSAYGYHPLSLSLLVGLINEDHRFAQRGDIAAVKNLQIFDDVKARRHHVLERAYESLAPERRDLLSKISCFRGSMEYAVLKKVFPSPDLDKALLDLRKRGLLQQSTSPLLVGEGAGVRFDMHPIVRHYAYDHFTDEKRRKEAHVQLAMHFIDAMPVTNTKVKTLEDLAPVIELYHHMVGAGNLDEALKLLYDRLTNTLYFQFGAYQLEIELLRALFLDGEDKPPRLKKDDAQAWTLNELANTYSLSGQPRRAVPLFEGYISISEKANDKKNAAIGLGNVANMAQIFIGALKESEHNLQRAISLSQESGDEAYVGFWQSFLGQVLVYCSRWKESEESFHIAEQMEKKVNNVQAQGVNWSYRAQRFLLIARANPQSKIVNLKSSIECAQRALELADEWTRTQYPVPRDYVRAYWLLGAAYCANSDLTLAEENLSKALNLCRQINLVDMEADILLDLARLRYAQGDFKDAQEKASEALMITERSGYVLQGADVNLFLAQYALEQEKDKAKAKAYAESALKLAHCDDGPPYYYKVAYEEAERFLENLK
jgi:tetratricopeptide (TPR) repeat protein